MTQHRSQGRRAFVAALVVLAQGACSSSPKAASSTTTPTTAASTSPDSGTSHPTVAIATTKLGRVLVNSQGLTLYLYNKDIKPGLSSCTDICAQVWPPLIVTGTPTYGTGLTSSMFSTITRTDGSHQLAVNGKPLYRFSSDTVPGATQGQGEGDFFVAGANGTKING